MNSHQPGLNFSHIGIFAHDLDTMAGFYKSFLGFTETDRGRLDSPRGPLQLVFLSRNPDEHHQIVMVSGRPETMEFNSINQISLRADSLETLQLFYKKLQDSPASEVIPVTHGNAISVYFLDPEKNRVELYIDTPWYVSQPCRVQAPIEWPADELMDWAEKHARQLPGFRPRSEWREEMARRMEADQRSWSIKS